MSLKFDHDRRAIITHPESRQQGLSFWGPRIFLHLFFLALPEYSLRGGVEDIYHHTHSFWSNWPS